MTLTPQSFTSLSNCKEFRRVPNIGPMKRTARRLPLSKFVVIEYVTLSFECFAVSGSQRAWWKRLAQIMPIAWSSNGKVAIILNLQCYKRRGDWLSLDESRQQDAAPRVGTIRKRARDLVGLCWSSCMFLFMKMFGQLQQTRNIVVRAWYDWILRHWFASAPAAPIMVHMLLVYLLRAFLSQFFINWATGSIQRKSMTFRDGSLPISILWLRCDNSVIRHSNHW